uniref:Uncharacterized protein n=1 Tax=Lactuca sativa TaxID=4236 RepID=A0A9R1XSU9_LACSA|nr:hypothetical protein LSAT_V11C100034850 [Lactuca sativa]
MVQKLISGSCMLLISCIWTSPSCMGFVINLILNLTPEASPAMLARANVYQWVIYVSQVNFANKEEVMNYLFSTYISRVVFHPIMPEAELIRNMLG